ncbi:hypothetical protein [Paraburkholderia sp. BCC1885]|uniref:hypothetical protein n=1 Tax=Paraburkholderia sp. BCC1885 TaxID=2562669 RepID=UPI0016425345|nr:hypothetical protein [Paraburkholderia sp. BCC1885]
MHADQLNQFRYWNFVPNLLFRAGRVVVAETFIEFDQHDGSAIERRLQYDVTTCPRFVTDCADGIPLQAQLSVVSVT